MSARLASRTAVVTGAGRGIGLAVVQRLLEEGAAVVMTQRSASAGERACAALEREFPGRVRFVAADVRDRRRFPAVLDVAVETFGGIDVLCNNAGVGLLRSVQETTEQEYNEVLDINLKGLFFACASAIPHMLERGAGSIVNVGSVAGWVGFATDAAYCASKGGVLALTRQMALDYASRGIRVNCICPGFVETEMLTTYIESHDDPAPVRKAVVEMHPMGRLARPAEVAAAVAFLASDDASFITGESLAVDGGLLAR